MCCSESYSAYPSPQSRIYHAMSSIPTPLVSAINLSINRQAQAQSYRKNSKWLPPYRPGSEQTDFMTDVGSVQTVAVQAWVSELDNVLN